MTSFLKQITFKDNDTGSLFIIYVFSKQNTNLFFIQDWTGFEFIPSNEFEDYYNDGFLSYIENRYGCTFIMQTVTSDKDVLNRWMKMFKLCVDDAPKCLYKTVL